MKTIFCLIQTLFRRSIFIAAVCLCLSASIHGSSTLERLKTQFYAYLAAKAKRGGLEIIRQQLDPEITDFHILQKQHNEDLRAFFDALNTLGQDATGLMSRISSLLSSTDYFTIFDADAQKRHIAACQRAVFEVDWGIERSKRLTNSAFIAFIGKRKFGEKFLKTTKWPHAYVGLEKLAQQFQEKYPGGASNPYYFPRSVPYLASNIYEGETLTAAFNHNTSKQLLDWVQKKIDALFKLDITDVGMKYVLINLVRSPTTDQKALETLYRLAFFYDYSLRQEQNISAESEEITHILRQPDKNLGVIELKKLVSNLDWLSGRMTIFWQSRWQNQGTIQKALDLKRSVDLYNQLSAQFPEQSSLIPQPGVPSATRPSAIEPTEKSSIFGTIRKGFNAIVNTIGEINGQENVTEYLEKLVLQLQEYIEKTFEPQVVQIFNNFPKIPSDLNIWINTQRTYLDTLYLKIEPATEKLKSLKKVDQWVYFRKQRFQRAHEYLKKIPDYMENRIQNVQRTIKQLKQQPTSQQGIPSIPTQDMPALPQAPQITQQEVHPQQSNALNQIMELLKTLETLALQTNLHLDKEFMPTIDKILQQKPEEIGNLQSWLTSQEQYSITLLNQVDAKLKAVKQLIEKSGVLLDQALLQRFQEVEKDLVENIEYMDDKIQSIRNRSSGTAEQED